MRSQSKIVDIDALPPEFDPELYLRIYVELAGMTEAQAWEHYERHGRREGRIATLALPRRNFLALVPSDARVLEIGPGNRPGFSGPNVKYFDVRDPESLRQRAVNNGRDPRDVPQIIHYLASEGDFSTIPETFDVVFSSHAIEHQPDLVRHLQDVERLLDESGAYFILCPDKRYCFDAVIPESTIVDVLEAYLNGQRVHAIRTVLSMCLTTHNNTRVHWRDEPKPMTVDLNRLKKGLDVVRAANGGYIDAHAWRFTPRLFRQIIEILHELELIKFRPARVYDTLYGWNEFGAVLIK